MSISGTRSCDDRHVNAVHRRRLSSRYSVPPLKHPGIQRALANHPLSHGMTHRFPLVGVRNLQNGAILLNKFWNGTSVINYMIICMVQTSKWLLTITLWQMYRTLPHVMLQNIAGMQHWQTTVSHLQWHMQWFCQCPHAAGRTLRLIRNSSASYVNQTSDVCKA